MKQYEISIDWDGRRSKGRKVKFRVTKPLFVCTKQKYKTNKNSSLCSEAALQLVCWKSLCIFSKDSPHGAGSQISDTGGGMMLQHSSIQGSPLSRSSSFARALLQAQLPMPSFLSSCGRRSYCCKKSRRSFVHSLENRSGGRKANSYKA